MNFYEAWQAMRKGKTIQLKMYPKMQFRLLIAPTSPADDAETQFRSKRLYLVYNGKDAREVNRHETYYLDNWMVDEWEIVE